MKRGAWGTKLGFYFAAVGSAFGLGSLWRFPYIVEENGGAAFVLLYALLVFVFGLPLMIGELLLGKATGRSLVSAAAMLEDNSSDVVEKDKMSVWLKRILPGSARLAAVVCLVLLSYYSVICGWVLFYLMQFVKDLFVSGGLQPLAANSYLMDSGWLQVLLTSVHLLMVIVVVGKDVEEGLERWVANIMPVFVLILLLMMVKSLSLETQAQALRFLFYPDFSQLNLSSFAHAVGHALFALSLGFGTMVTFGSYLNSQTYVPLAGLRIATLDFLISVFAALLVFPLVFSSTLEAEGTQLLFKTVPDFFLGLPGGAFFGVGFFLCLYLAALSASINLLETVVANIVDRHHFKRTSAAWFSGALCFIVALVPALSSTVFKGINFDGRGLLEVLDLTLINWILPLITLVISIAIGSRLSESVKKREFIESDEPITEKLYSHWVFAIKWMVPGIIVVAYSLELIGIFKN